MNQKLPESKEVIYSPLKIKSCAKWKKNFPIVWNLEFGTWNFRLVRVRGVLAPVIGAGNRILRYGAFMTLLVIIAMGVLVSCTQDMPTVPARLATIEPAPSQWDSLVATARKEGKVVIYGEAPPKLREGLAAAIKSDFGIELEFLTGRGEEVSAKFLSEWKAGIRIADIFFFGANTLVWNVKPQGILDRIEPLVILPGVTDPKAWRDGKLPFLDTDHKIIPLTLGVSQLLLINTDQVRPGEIGAYKELIKPQWKGKIIMSDPTIGSTANSWVTYLLEKAYGPVQGAEFLASLAAQAPVITRDSRLQSEGLARGKYPVGIALSSQAASEMAAAGVPVARISPEEGGLLSGVGGSYVGLPSERPHPNASILLANWLLSARGQEVFSKSSGNPASRLGITGEGLSSLTLPRPGEKLFIQDEEFVKAHENARAVAKNIFGPLMTK